MDLYERLLKAYGRRNWWPAETPYEVMVGAILTQNTNWGNVQKAIANFGERLTPEFVAGVPLEELAEIIRPSGYYNQKAIKLKALTEWFKKYDYDIERAREVDGEVLREELLAVKGVGRETADSILTYALNKPFFVIDAYTRRIFYRLGYQVPKDYDAFRLEIEDRLPKELELFNEYHALIVGHAVKHCKKKSNCEDCPLEDRCHKIFGG